MKKTKKFDDGGPTGGRYEMNGDSGRYVENAPVAAPVAVGIEPRQLGPMSGGVGAGIGGLQNAAGRAETLMPFVAGNNGPEPIRRPIGQLMPPPTRRISVPGAVPGTYAEMTPMAAGMKKGGTVKKMAKGGSVSSASKRADGCAIKGKTKGRFV
jgi:hypothetical protein